MTASPSPPTSLTRCLSLNENALTLNRVFNYSDFLPDLEGDDLVDVLGQAMPLRTHPYPSISEAIRLTFLTYQEARL